MHRLEYLYKRSSDASDASGFRSLSDGADASDARLQSYSLTGIGKMDIHAQAVRHGQARQFGGGSRQMRIKQKTERQQTNCGKRFFTAFLVWK